MQTKQRVSKILTYQIVGYGLIIVLSWLNELVDLPHIIGAKQYILDWHESLFETIIVILVAIPAVLLSRRLLARLYYLEGFLRVCAWCKKINLDGDWVSLEEFFERKLETNTSHGICEACNERMKAEMNQRSAAA